MSSTMLHTMKIRKESRGTPVINYCKKLINEGYSPEDELHAFRGDKTEPDVIVHNIGLVARLSVKDTKFRFE